MDMESSMARLQSRRDWGLFLNRYTPDLSRYTPELFLEIEDLEELENTDHWSEDSEEAERYWDQLMSYQAFECNFFCPCSIWLFVTFEVEC